MLEPDPGADYAPGARLPVRPAGAITAEADRSSAAQTSIGIDEPGVQVVIGVSTAAVDAAVGKIGKSRSNIQNN